MRLTRYARSTAVHRGVIAIVAGIAVLAVPELLGRLVVWLVGAVAVAVGLSELWKAFRDRQRASLFRGLVLVGIGLAVLVGSGEFRRNLEIIVSALIAIRAAHSIVVAWRSWRQEGEDPFWGMARGFLWISLAVALVLVPEQLFTLVLIGVAVSWILTAVVVLVNTIGQEEDNEVPDDVIGVIRSNSMAADLRRQVTDSIFEGWDSPDGTLRFAALMSFATAIATFGVKADSTAVVIGAMLIAPLMSPIMALSASILMGWPRRAGYSGWRVTLGVGIGVGGSFVLSLVAPEFVQITSNSEVLSRVAPTTLDLMIALAAGAAGGYAVTHPEVGNSLPGVAIAVALAPPLAVVGVSLEAGEFGFAGGALLLFLTNLVGIVVASGVTYILSGYSPWTKLERSGEQGWKSLVLVGIALVLVTLPLALIGDEIIDSATARGRAEATVQGWLGDDTSFDIARLTVNGPDVTVAIVGPGDPPPAQDLADDLSASLDRAVTLELNVVPEEQHVVRSGEG